MIDNARRPPIRNELYIEVNQRMHKVCSMNIVKKTRDDEFYYHLGYPKNLANKVFNYSTSTFDPLNYMSFHKDGRVHLKYKNDPAPKSIGAFIDRSFTPNGTEKLTPLLIHSVYECDGFILLPVAKERDIDNNDLKLFRFRSLSTSKPFSVIVFLSPAKRTLCEVLMHRLPHFDINRSFRVGDLADHAYRIMEWDDWAIDCVVSGLVLPVHSDKLLDSSYQAFACDKLQSALNDLIESKDDVVEDGNVSEEICAINIFEFNNFVRNS
jgi:hypothetical protein